ncbi:MAG: CYTH domain-containing protein, partial [Oscillospiraceae bacterium]
MIENEFKLALTEEQYNTIHSDFEWDREISQTNNYYDTDDLTLSDEHITCRVRELAGEFFLQMKLPADKLYSRVELEKKLGNLPETLTGEELTALCGREGLPSVKRLGKLTTTRSIKEYDGAEIDLDKSEYFGKTDYELEIEFTNEQTARKLLAQITERLGVKPESEVCTGKIRRFLEEYKKTVAPKKP